MKYKIEKSEGCTAFYTLVNGKNINDLSPEELGALYDYVLSKIKEGLLGQTTSFDSVMEVLRYVDYENDGKSCETCGDSVSRTTWEI